MTPSNMSGALPMTTASMSAQSSPASSRARAAASRTRPAIETSSRLAAWLGLARRRSPHSARPSRPLPAGPRARPPGRTPGSAGGTGPRWRGRGRCRALPSMMRVAASPMRRSPATIRALAARAPPEGLTATDVRQAERLAQDRAPGGRTGRAARPRRRAPRRAAPPAPSKTPGALRRRRGSRATRSGHGRPGRGSRCGGRCR